MVKILVMPGTGDIYWIMTKMESFIEKRLNGEIPDVYVWEESKNTLINQKPRSEEFLERIPFVNYKGSWSNPKFNNNSKEFNKFYSIKSPSPKKINSEPSWVQENVFGFDFIFNMNGVLEAGGNLTTDYGLDYYDTNWYFDLIHSDEQAKYEKFYKDKYGEYNIGYFNDVIFYGKHFASVLSPSDIYEILLTIYKTTNRKTILIGAAWDKPFQEQLLNLDSENILINEIENTTQTQLFSLTKSAELVIGWASGATLMAPYFNTKSIIYWASKQFINNNELMVNAIDSTLLGDVYHPIDISTIDKVAHLSDIEDIIK